MRIRFIVFLAFITTLCNFACTESVNTAKVEESNKTVSNTTQIENKAATTKNFDNKVEANTARQVVNPRGNVSIDGQTKNVCLSVKLEKRKLWASQTFPIDFEPYRNACFVTFADPEQMVSADDLPRGSEFYIYKDGKQLLKLPNAFNDTSGCWVEGVAFEDLNNDSLTDIVIAGKCLAAKDSYNQNMVYANTGDSFTTNEEANEKLGKFSKLRDISDFAKRNQNLFF